jgi:hypothetical protein
MALVTCPECKAEISGTADKCAKCGFSMPKKKRPLAIGFGVIAVLVSTRILGSSHGNTTAITVGLIAFVVGCYEIWVGLGLKKII